MGAPKRSEDVVLSWPADYERAAPLTRVRSTMLSTSVTTLRAHGMYDRYMAALDPSYRSAIEGLVAATWVPVELAMAHYRACDRMELSPAEATALGRKVAGRAWDSWLQTAKRLATGAGFTPWTIIAQYDRLWQRSFEGGRFRIVRVGPKDAVLHVSLFPLAELAYFRAGFCGLSHEGLGFFSSRCYVRPLPTSTRDAFACRASWA